MSLLHKLVAAAEEQRSTAVVTRDIRAHFVLEEERPFYDFVTRHIRHHGAIPSEATIRAAGFEPEQHREPASYYVDRIRQRFVYNAINERHPALVEAMSGRNTEEAVRVIREMTAEAGRAGTAEMYSTLVAEVAGVIEEYDERRLQGGLAGVSTGWPSLDEMTQGMMGGDVIVIAGRAGMGKALPITEPVLMRDGRFFPMKEMKVGKAVASVDGRESVVTGVYPQGEIGIYEITFSDGRKSRCCKEHLWSVYYSGWTPQWRTITTEQVIELLSKKRYQGRLYIERVNGDFGHTESEIDPYVVGVLLGDGGITKQACFTTEDPEIADRVNRLLPEGLLVSKDNWNALGYTIVREVRRPGRFAPKHELIEWLRDEGLFGHTAEHKFIPKWMFSMNRADRLKLLQGLLDTDGTVSLNAVSFSTVSKVLAQDVCQLARSLGYVSSWKPKNRKSGLSYYVSVMGAGKEEVFYLPRKRQATNEPARNAQVSFSSIRYVGKEQAQCITVSHPSSLFVTRDYVVTHNSWLLNEIGYNAWLAGHSIACVSMEMGKRQFVRRWMGRHLGINPNFIRSGQLSHWTESRLRGYTETASTMAGVYVVSGDMEKHVEGVSDFVEEVSPDLIMVDAAYLLSVEARRKGGIAKWEMISEVIAALKKMSIRQDRPVLITVQLNRQAARVKREFDTSDVSGSDSIPQDASILMGVRHGMPPFEKITRQVEVIKNREGATGQFETKFTFCPPCMEEITADMVSTDSALSGWMT